MIDYKNNNYSISWVKNGKWYKNMIYTFFKSAQHKNVELKEKNNSDLLIITDGVNDNDLKKRKYRNIIGVSGEPQNNKTDSYNPKITFYSYISNKSNNVWFPYILMGVNEQSLKKVINKDFKEINKRKNFLVYANRNCISKRDNFFKLIQKYSNNTAKSIGKCMNTHDGPKRDSWVKNGQQFEDYKFVMALENTSKKGYITEKIWNAYVAGAIPIYWGCSYSASLFFNKDTYIDINDFKNDEECAKYVVELNKNPKKLKEIQSKNIFKDGKIPDMFNWRNPNSKYHKDVVNFIKKNGVLDN